MSWRFDARAIIWAATLLVPLWKFEPAAQHLPSGSCRVVFARLLARVDIDGAAWTTGIGVQRTPFY